MSEKLGGGSSGALTILSSKTSDLESIGRAVKELEGLVPATRTTIKSYKIFFYHLAKGYHTLGNREKCCFYMHRALLLDPGHRETLQLFNEVSVEYSEEIALEFAKPEAVVETTPVIKENSPTQKSSSTETKPVKPAPKTSVPEIRIRVPTTPVEIVDFRGVPLIKTKEILSRVSLQECEEKLRTFRHYIGTSKSKKKSDRLCFSEQDYYRNNPHTRYFSRFSSFKNLCQRVINIYFCINLVSDVTNLESCVVGFGKSARTILEDGSKRNRFEVDSFSPKIWIDQYFVSHAIQTKGNIYDCLNLLFESVILHRERVVRKKTFRDFIIAHFKTLQKKKILEHKKKQTKSQNPSGEEKQVEEEEEEENLEEVIRYPDFDHFLLPLYQLLLEMRLLPMCPEDDEKSFHKFVSDNTKTFFLKLLKSVKMHELEKMQEADIVLKKGLTKLEFMTAMVNFHHRLVCFNLLDEVDYKLEKNRIEVPKFVIDSSNYRKFGRKLYFGTKEFNFGLFVLYGMTLIYQHYNNVKKKDNITPEDFLSTYQVTLPKLDFDTKFESNKEENASHTAQHHAHHDPIGGKFKTYENAIVQMKTFAFSVFRNLRKIFGIDDRSFFEDTFSVIKLLGNWLLLNYNTNLYFQHSMGKSGTFFFYSYDGKYLVKKLSKGEFKLLMTTLPHYYGHQSRIGKSRGSFSSLCKYCFCFSLNIKQKRDDGMEFVEDMLFRDGYECQGGETYYFVIMKNIFSTNDDINEIYDLKGSKLKRSNSKGPVMKDNDLKRKLRIGKEAKDELFKILNRDVEMLNHLELTDYSLLLGIHYKRGRRATILPNQFFPKGVNEKIDLKSLAKQERMERKKRMRKEMKGQHVKKDVSSLKGMFQGLEGVSVIPGKNEVSGENRKNLDVPKVGVSNELDVHQIRELYQEDEFEGFEMFVPETRDQEEGEERNEFFTKDGGIPSVNGKEVYYVGIIDLLTKYTFSKLAERTAKSIRNLGGRAEISSAPHKYYSKRFLYFLDNVFQ